MWFSAQERIRSETKLRSAFKRIRTHLYNLIIQACDFSTLLCVSQDFTRTRDSTKDDEILIQIPFCEKSLFSTRRLTCGTHGTNERKIFQHPNSLRKIRIMRRDLLCMSCSLKWFWWLKQLEKFVHCRRQFCSQKGFELSRYDVTWLESHRNVEALCR